MLEALFGNATVGLVLLYLERNGKLYATELSRGLDIPLNMVQKQLEKLERGGIMVGRREGRRKIYRWNKDFGLLTPLRQFLARANALGTGDPADGLHFTLSERITQSEALWREMEQLRRPKAFIPFAQSFDTWRDHEQWKGFRQSSSRG